MWGGGVLPGLLLGLFPLGCSLEARPLPAVPEATKGSVGAAETQTSAGNDEWAYSGARGPAAWAGLRPEWSACGATQGQSPVDLPLDALGAASPGAAAAPQEGAAVLVAPRALPANLELKLGKLPLEAQGDGRLVRLLGSSSQLMSVDGAQAELERIEVHTPAEHRLGGVSLDVELVLWFKGGAHPMAMSLLFRQGQPSPALEPLVSRLPPAGVYESKSLQAMLSLDELVGPEPKFFSYEGSATTPPCAPGVLRLVLARVGELSLEQLAQLRRAAGPQSARPTQDLGGRPVGVLSVAPSAGDTPVRAP